ncbi:uncharacterized protein [Prorops nasuta]|uniref:uncharacterized protein n=1 Tax=Prorops nasuta TaxID=863751 RepID=UPI0034CDE7F7
MLREIWPILAMSRMFGCYPHSILTSPIRTSKAARVYSWALGCLYTSNFLYKLCIWHNYFGSRWSDVVYSALVQLGEGSKILCIIFGAIMPTLLHKSFESAYERAEVFDAITNTKNHTKVRPFWQFIMILVNVARIPVYKELYAYYTITTYTLTVFSINVAFEVLYANELLKFWFLLSAFWRRFHRLNQITRADARNDKYVRKLSVDDIQNFYTILADGIAHFNKYYNYQLFFWVSYLTMDTMSFILATYTAKQPRAGLYFDVCLLSGQLSMITYICHLTCAQANKLTHVYFSPSCPVFLRTNVMNNVKFGLLLHSRRINIVALRTFQIDFPLLVTIAATMTTYMVIFIQPS